MSRRRDPGRVPPWEGRAAREALRWVKARGRAEDTPCVICGQRIDYDLTYPDPGACTVQHVRSRRDFPELTWTRSNWAPAHATCNAAAGAGNNAAPDLGVMTLDTLTSRATAATDTAPVAATSTVSVSDRQRTVVLLTGPPGAGKTTAARSSGLTVFDRDDPQWSHDETRFTRALSSLATEEHAHAVVIRSGATSTARAKAAGLVAATHTFVLLAEREELIRRVAHRDRADRVRTIAGIGRWLDRFDRDDDVRDFPGWAAALAPDLGVTS